MKLIKSPLASKKYRAVFDDGTHTDFGASGYKDFTIHRDMMRQMNYLSRHRTTENWNDYKSAGALSRWILWSEPTIAEGLKKYKERFNL